MELKIDSDKVMKLAEQCPEWKEGLKTLFPEAFKSQFDWNDFDRYPFKYLKITSDDEMEISAELVEAARIPSHWYPSMCLSMVRDLFDHLVKVRDKA